MKKTSPRFPRCQEARLAGVALLVSALCGCATLEGRVHQPRAAEFVAVNHAGDRALPPGLRRVVLLPVAGGSIVTAESTAMLDPVAAAVLEEQNRFEVVPMTRDECSRHFHVEEVSSVSALPPNLMEVIRREYNADAVLLVDVTVYSAYQPLAIGLRAKLAMADDARLVWTFDNVFSSDNASVAASATKYLRSREQAGLPADISTMSLESPTRFATYAAAAMFATLPPVKGAEADPSGAPRAVRDAAMKR
jgi:hypothetical protein